MAQVSRAGVATSAFNSMRTSRLLPQQIDGFPSQRPRPSLPSMLYRVRMTNLYEPPGEVEGGRGCGATLAALSILLLLPSLGTALIAPMAGDGGTITATGMAFLLFIGPVLLVGAAASGVACHRAYSRAKLALTIALFGLGAGPLALVLAG